VGRVFLRHLAVAVLRCVGHVIIPTGVRWASYDFCHPLTVLGSIPDDLPSCIFIAISQMGLLNQRARLLSVVHVPDPASLLLGDSRRALGHPGVLIRNFRTVVTSEAARRAGCPPTGTSWPRVFRLA
jgi:hypothetical protein